MVSERKGRTRKVDLPVVEEWVSAKEAADMAGVSRQYMHNQLGQFKTASRLSGFLVFGRKEIEDWVASREAALIADEWRKSETA